MPTRVSQRRSRYPLRRVSRRSGSRSPLGSPVSSLTSASMTAWASTRTPSRRKSDVAVGDRLAQRLEQRHPVLGHRGVLRVVGFSVPNDARMTRWPFSFTACPLLHQVWGHDRRRPPRSISIAVPRAMRNPAVMSATLDARELNVGGADGQAGRRRSRQAHGWRSRRLRSCPRHSRGCDHDFGFQCDGGVCICSGDRDCNDLFTTNLWRRLCFETCGGGAYVCASETDRRAPRPLHPPHNKSGGRAGRVWTPGPQNLRGLTRQARGCVGPNGIRNAPRRTAPI